MKRGEIWTLAGGGDYASKPRHVVIVQDDRFVTLNSVTVCLVTTELADLSLFRVPIIPNERNRLGEPSCAMADKLHSIRRTRLRHKIGQLDSTDLARVDRAILLFLGLAAAPDR